MKIKNKAKSKYDFRYSMWRFAHSEGSTQHIYDSYERSRHVFELDYFDEVHGLNSHRYRKDYLTIKIEDRLKRYKKLKAKGRLNFIKKKLHYKQNNYYRCFKRLLKIEKTRAQLKIPMDALKHIDDWMRSHDVKCPNCGDTGLSFHTTFEEAGYETTVSNCAECNAFEEKYGTWNNYINSIAENNPGVFKIEETESEKE